jgi:hypothetical protein
MFLFHSIFGEVFCGNISPTEGDCFFGDENPICFSFKYFN